MPFNSIVHLFEGSVAKKRHMAREIYDTHGTQLLAMDEVQQDLALLPHHAQELSKHMLSMNMDKLCGACGSKAEGGCCSIEMAGNSDAILLTMNLLLDCSIEIRRDDGFECYFLGPRGCSLILKPIFCLNYNCLQIAENNTKDDMKKLEQYAGNILRCQTRLENTIIQHLQSTKP